MRLELEAEGHAVQFVGINEAGAEDYVKELTNRTSFPIFQDLAEVDAWEMHGGGKDDLFVYDADGVLVRHFWIGDPDVTSNLAATQGYQNVKDAIFEALGL